MKSGARQYSSATAVPSDIKILLKEVVESSGEFQKRIDQTQVLIVQMILLARKRGRPSEKEEQYEEAA